MSNNTLYTALRRLEAGDAVTHVVEQQDGAPARKVYTITDRGHELLAELLRTLPAALARDSEEFLVRVSFFGELTPVERRGVIAARRAVVEHAVTQVREIVRTSEVLPSRAWRNHAMRRLLQDVERELGWLDELAASADEDAPALP